MRYIVACVLISSLTFGMEDQGPSEYTLSFKNAPCQQDEVAVYDAHELQQYFEFFNGLYEADIKQLPSMNDEQRFTAARTMQEPIPLPISKELFWYVAGMNKKNFPKYLWNTAPSSSKQNRAFRTALLASAHNKFAIFYTSALLQAPEKIIDDQAEVIAELVINNYSHLAPHTGSLQKLQRLMTNLPLQLQKKILGCALHQLPQLIRPKREIVPKNEGEQIFINPYNTSMHVVKNKGKLAVAYDGKKFPIKLDPYPQLTHFDIHVFNPHYPHLIALIALENSYIMLYDCKTQKYRAYKQQSDKNVITFAFSPYDKERAISADQAGKLQIWNYDENAGLTHHHNLHKHSTGSLIVNQIIFHPLIKQQYISRAGCLMNVWDMDKNQELFGRNLYPSSLISYGPNGETIITATHRNIEIVDSQTGNLLKEFNLCPSSINTTPEALSCHPTKPIIIARLSAHKQRQWLAAIDLRNAKELDCFNLASSHLHELTQRDAVPTGTISFLPGSQKTEFVVSGFQIYELLSPNNITLAELPLLAYLIKNKNVETVAGFPGSRKKWRMKKVRAYLREWRKR